jgi:hypothetical protein
LRVDTTPSNFRESCTKRFFAQGLYPSANCHGIFHRKTVGVWILSWTPNLSKHVKRSVSNDFHSHLRVFYQFFAEFAGDSAREFSAGKPAGSDLADQGNGDRYSGADVINVRKVLLSKDENADAIS